MTFLAPSAKKVPDPWIRILKCSSEKPDTLHFSVWHRLYECTFLCNVTAQKWNNKSRWHVVFFLIPRIYASFFSATHGFSAGLFQYMLMEISRPLSLPIPKALPKSVSLDEKQLRKQLKGTKWPGRVLSPRRPCLSEKGPSLLTSINPRNCVVGGSSWGILSWSVQCSVILCDLGDVQREK